MIWLCSKLDQVVVPIAYYPRPLNIPVTITALKSVSHKYTGFKVNITKWTAATAIPKKIRILIVTLRSDDKFIFFSSVQIYAVNGDCISFNENLSMRENCYTYG